MIDKTYQQYKAAQRGRDLLVDELTAGDLYVDEVYAKLDGTLSGPGGSMLYYWLRNQCKDKKSLDARLALSGFFIGNDKITSFIRTTLRRLGTQKRGSLIDELLDGGPEPFAEYRIALLAWAFAYPALIALSLLFQVLPFFVIAAVCLVNLILFLKTTSLISLKAGSIAYFCRLKTALFALSDRAVLGRGNLHAQRLAETAARVRKIKVHPVLFMTPLTFAGDTGDSILMYFKVFFLGELASFLRFYGKLVQERESVLSMFELLGEIDVSLCIDGLLRSEAVRRCGFAKGEAAKGETAPGGIIEARGMVHPLIEGCVPFSLPIRRDLIITGTNMSGKTTFIRTLGINQILATTLGICCAQYFSTDFLKVVSSISLNDSLLNAKSRYLCEAERMLSIIGTAKECRCLALVDEILTGTNSSDRIRAAIGILRHLAETDSIVVATTHDLEIANAVGGTYEPFFFEEDIVDGDIVFDYLLKPGIIARGNALRILAHLGFGEFVSDLKN